MDAPEADRRAGRRIPDEAWRRSDREIEAGGDADQRQTDSACDEDRTAAAAQLPGEWRRWDLRIGASLEGSLPVGPGPPPPGETPMMAISIKLCHGRSESILRFDKFMCRPSAIFME